MGRATKAWAIAGPAAFAVASAVGGRMERGYRPMDEPISALAAKGTRSARVMIPGFLGLAAGSVGLARQLRGAAVAPAPIPAMLATAGLTVGAAGLARNSDRSCPTRLLGDSDVQPSDDVHAAVSFATFLLWIALPWVAAARARDASARYRARCRLLGLTTTATFFGGGLLARSPSQRGSGAGQRAMLASAFSWYLLAGWSADR